MFDIRSNSFENRLLICYKGKIEIDEMKAASDKISKSIRGLVPGFTIITDIRELAPLAEGARELLQGSMQMVRTTGLAYEVRIISPAAQITANQFQRTSRAAGYTATEVKTLVEAERVLDDLV